MTELQKKILSHLLLGASINGNAKYGYRLLDEKKNCLVRFHYNTFFKIKPYLRKVNANFVISKNYVRKLNGNCFAKKQYRLLNVKVKMEKLSPTPKLKSTSKTNKPLKCTFAPPATISIFYRPWHCTKACATPWATRLPCMCCAWIMQAMKDC
jgi:hypothetical protein